MRYVGKFSDFLGKYFVYLVVLTAVSALFKPELFLTLGKIKPFGQSLVNLGLGFIMFIMGLTLNLEDFKVIFIRPKEVLIGCVAQFTVMPLAAFLLAKIFNLPPQLAIGLVLLGACPGGTASNVMTYIAKGDVALSVAMTTVSTFISPLLTPFLTMVLVGEWVKIDVMTMFLGIIQVVIVPSLMGIGLHALLKERVERYSKLFVIPPILCILMIMGMCVAPNKQNLINSSLMLILAVSLHNWIGFLLGYVIGNSMKMNINRKKTLAIEVGLQNSALAIGLSAQFANPLCALPGAVATVIHQISGSVLANLFSRARYFVRGV